MHNKFEQSAFLMHEIKKFLKYTLFNDFINIYKSIKVKNTPRPV